MMIPSIAPPLNTFSSSLKPFSHDPNFQSSSHIESSGKINDEERRTKLPPMQFYYDQLNRDLAAKSRCGRSASLDEYRPHEEIEFKNNGFALEASINKSQPHLFEEGFYKKNIDNFQPKTEHYQDLTTNPYHQQRRRIQSASLLPYGNVNRTIPFTLPYFTSRHELPRYDSARFSMSNLLRQDNMEPNIKQKSENDEKNNFARQGKSQLMREYSNDSGYLSDPSSYKHTSALLHDKNGRFPELRKGEPLTNVAHTENQIHGNYPTRNVLPSISTLRNYKSNVQKTLLERESLHKRASADKITVQCSQIDSTHTSDDMKYGVEGLLGLTKVANEQLGPAVVKEKKRTKNNNCLHLWQFLRRMLNDEQYKPNRCIEWTNREVGEFRLIKTAVIADLWGQSKNRKCMTYEKMARAMRYYYKMKILEKVPHKRLHFRFGEKMLPKVLDYKSSKMNYDSLTYKDFIQRNLGTLPNYPTNQYIHSVKQEFIDPYQRKSVICPINQSDLIDQASQTSTDDGKIREIKIADTADESILRQPSNNVMDTVTSDEHVDVENSDYELENNSACTTPFSSHDSHDGDIEQETS